MISQTETKPPWAMQPSEDGLHYKLFISYLKMEPEERSLAKVAAIAGRSTRNIEYHSVNHRWVERCRSYDEYILSQQLEHHA